MLALVILVIVVLVAMRLGTRTLPPSSSAPQDRQLAEQAERIEELEDELRRLKEQADFTERLLTERVDDPPSDEDDFTG
jgi:uncharacterized membrane-anchored protein YhcB (DUF1043 family)